MALNSHPKNRKRELFQTERGDIVNFGDYLSSNGEWDSDGDIAPVGKYDLNIEETDDGNLVMWFTDGKHFWSKIFEFKNVISLSKVTIWNKSDLTSPRGSSTMQMYYVAVGETTEEVELLKEDPTVSPIIDLHDNGVWNWKVDQWIFTPDITLADYKVGRFIFSFATGRLYFVHAQGQILGIPYFEVDPTPIEPA